MNPMNLVLVGESPLVEELGELAMQAGHSLSLVWVEQLADASAFTKLVGETHGADVVLEAHNESKTAKREIVRLLDESLPPERPLLVSCLAASTTEVASWTRHPERVVGWGALPPIVASGAGGTGSAGEPAGLVELARALQTGDAAYDAAQQCFAGLGLTCIPVPDGPGLVRARVVCSLINEAASALGDDVASAADIDTAMQLGTNYPRGPLAWADHIGLDVVLGVLTGLQEEYGAERYRPAPLLRRMVQAGLLGKKAGRGFFEYPA